MLQARFLPCLSTKKQSSGSNVVKPSFSLKWDLLRCMIIDIWIWFSVTIVILSFGVHLRLEYIEQ